MSTVLWQRIEGALVFLAVVLLFMGFGVSLQAMPWWIVAALFFAPDLTFAAYLLGPRVGAAAYNLAHLYATGLILAALGLLGIGPQWLTLLGLLWLAHAGFDRMLGYGLKEPTAFGDTHLGRIGRG